jgi:ABC-type Fe3+/spermidine/putrescine transport system ATPase subunit
MATETPNDPTTDDSKQSEHAVEVAGLRRVYDGDILAVDDIDFTISHGDFCVIIGPSGCGKTTTLHSIIGKVTPTAGEIYIDGEEVTDAPTHERDIGLVFQDFQLFPHMNVEENVRYGLEQTDQVDDQVVEEMLELMDLTEQRAQSTGELSAGQRQRVALARSLVLQPDVLLLDEPLGDMDYKLQKRMEQELLRIHREVQTTFVYVTHDQRQAMRMGDQVIVMNDGQIEQSGSAQAVYDTPANAFVAAFVGDSNILDGTVVETEGETVEIETNLGRFRTTAEATPPEPGTTAYLVIRPHHLSVTADGATEPNSVDGTVRDVIEHPVAGTEVFVRTTENDGEELRAQIQNLQDDLSQGETLTLTWSEDDAHLLTELSVVSGVDLETDILGE